MRRFGRTLGLLLLGFLLLLGLLLAILPGREGERSRSVFSTEPGGQRALYLLLEELGYRVAAWTRAPGELPRSGDLLVLPDVPEPPPGLVERGAGVRRVRDLRHYRRFVDEGGTLVLLLSGDEEQELGFLGEALELEELDDLELAPRSEELPLHVLTRSGELLELSRSGERRLAGAWPGQAEILASQEDDRPVALRLPVGRGALVLVMLPPELFSNASIDQQDNALFFVRLLEELAPRERVLFDEYTLGGWAPRSPLSLAFLPGARLLSAHLVLLLLLCLWRSAWAGPFARDPEPLAVVSALARAEGASGLLERAGRHDLLARSLLGGALARWCTRAGLRAPATGPGGRLAPEPVEATLAALFRRDPRLLERARRIFREPRVRSESQLARLDRRLAELEHERFPDDSAAGDG